MGLAHIVAVRMAALAIVVDNPADSEDGLGDSRVVGFGEGLERPTEGVEW